MNDRLKSPQKKTTFVSIKNGKSFKGPGQRATSIVENNAPKKWLRRRWVTLLTLNGLFFCSFFFDIQILEGTLSSSRLFGFHLADPFAALQIMLASQLVKVNLMIGLVTIVIFYVLFGGRSFCSWVCPYGALSEIGEWLQNKLRARGYFKREFRFSYRIKWTVATLFLATTFLSGHTVFEVINPIGIISRAIVYGSFWSLFIVLLFLTLEVCLSRRAWCRYFCPVSVFYAMLGRLSPLRITWNVNKCTNCKACQKVCIVPFVLSDTVNKGNGEFVLSGECTRCAMCIDACDDAALTFKVQYLDTLI